jgi:hypothetical protein
MTQAAMLAPVVALGASTARKTVLGQPRFVTQPPTHATWAQQHAIEPRRAGTMKSR